MAQTSCHSVFTGSPPPLLSDLDLTTAYDLEFGDICLRRGSSSRIDVKQATGVGTGLRDIGARNLYLENLRNYFTNQDWWSGSNATSYIKMNSHDGSVYQEVMEALGGMVNIPRLGDTTLLAGKKLGVSATGIFLLPTSIGGQSRAFYYDEANEQLVYDDGGVIRRWDHI